MGLTFHCDKNLPDCPLKNYALAFPKFTAWGILLSAGIFPDGKDCGNAVNHWHPVFMALAGYKDKVKVPTLAEVGLRSEHEEQHAENDCKQMAEGLLSALGARPQCSDCKLWWCY